MLRGEPAIPRALVQRLIEELVHPRAGDAGPQGGLTARQREVLELLLGGLTTAEIASRLSVTDVTVRRHLSDILRRTGAADRNQLRERFGRGP